MEEKSIAAAPLVALVVEDNRSDALLTRALLRKANPRMQVLHADRLSRGLEVMSRRSLDVILLDLTLPDGGGIENIDTIRAVAPQVPIVVLTDVDDARLETRMLQAGVQEFLVKGQFNGQGLTRAIRRALERQELLRRLEKARELEQYLAYHDALTGLPNRQLMTDRLHQVLVKARRNGAIVGVLIVDLDSFKSVNDLFGYGVGDHLLKETAVRLRRCLRESDTLARLSGDEFIIILDDLKREQDVAGVARKVLEMLAGPVYIDGNEIKASVSIGISVFPDDGPDLETLIRNADTALYRAKGQGRNTYQLYNLSMDIHAAEQAELEESLRRALERDEFILHYQPLMDIASGGVRSVEALLRWQHPKYGLVTPDRFIPQAEDSGLIDPIGEWVLQRACQENVKLQKAGLPPVRMAVNLSARQFRNRNLHDMVLGTLDRTGMNPSCLGLEITESNAMKDVEYSIQTLRMFKEAGVKVAIDDFGTGYSSLSYLKRFPIDTLKVDRSFIHGVPNDRDDKSITSAIIFLAHNLDLGVIAEGVETRSQLSYLKAMRCDEVQGFYYSRPLTYANLESFMRKNPL